MSGRWADGRMAGLGVHVGEPPYPGANGSTACFQRELVGLVVARCSSTGVEEDVKQHQDTNTACVVGTGQNMDRAQNTALTNRGTRQSKRATRVMACATRRPKCIQGSGSVLRAVPRCQVHPGQRIGQCKTFFFYISCSPAQTALCLET
jgi:hypothetical protein